MADSILDNFALTPETDESEGVKAEETSAGQGEGEAQAQRQPVGESKPTQQMDETKQTASSPSQEGQEQVKFAGGFQNKAELVRGIVNLEQRLGRKNADLDFDDVNTLNQYYNDLRQEFTLKAMTGQLQQGPTAPQQGQGQGQAMQAGLATPQQFPNVTQQPQQTLSPEEQAKQKQELLRRFVNNPDEVLNEYAEKRAQALLQEALGPLSQVTSQMATSQMLQQMRAQYEDFELLEPTMTEVFEQMGEAGPMLVQTMGPRFLEVLYNAAKGMKAAELTATAHQQGVTSGRQELARSLAAGSSGRGTNPNQRLETEAPKTEADRIRESILAAAKRRRASLL